MGCRPHVCFALDSDRTADIHDRQLRATRTTPEGSVEPLSEGLDNLSQSFRIFVDHSSHVLFRTRQVLSWRLFRRGWRVRTLHTCELPVNPRGPLIDQERSPNLVGCNSTPRGYDGNSKLMSRTRLRITISRCLVPMNARTPSACNRDIARDTVSIVRPR